MTVFLLLVSLIFWTLVYSGCCAKEGFDNREKAKLLRPAHRAEDYKALYDYIEKVWNYYVNVLNEDSSRVDELILKFPELDSHTRTAHSACDHYTLSLWAGSAWLNELEKRYDETYKHPHQRIKASEVELWPVCGYGFQQSKYDRLKELDKATNRWVEYDRKRYHV